MFWSRPYDRGTALATAEKARQRGKVRKAVKWYLKVLKNEPADLQTTAKVAPLLARLGRWDESRQRFESAAQGFLAQGFAPKAIAVWTVAAQTFPEHVEYWERIANQQVMLGKRADAILALLQGRSMLTKKRQRPLPARLLRQALELQPGRIQAR